MGQVTLIIGARQRHRWAIVAKIPGAFHHHGEMFLSSVVRAHVHVFTRSGYIRASLSTSDCEISPPQSAAVLLSSSSSP